jgi:hypothetical protein
VVSTKKISEVYTEEGYEDSAYDHGGFAKEAANQEGYDHHEGSKHKPTSRRQKVRVTDDSESQGTQAQAKQVDAKGEQLKSEDSLYPPNTWMRHKVMRNEKRLMFVENQGGDGVPMKLMASYSHTIQHPGSKTEHKNRTSTTEAKLLDSHTVNSTANSFNPIQKVLPSNVNSQPLKLVAGKTRNSKQQQNQKQITPFFFVPTETEQHEDKSINSYAELREKLYGTGTRKLYPSNSDINYKKYAKPLSKERVNQSKYKPRGESSNALNEQQYEGSSVSVKYTEPHIVTVDSGLVPESMRNNVVREMTTTLDSIYLRKHPSIPLEEIQNAQIEIVPAKSTHNDFTKYFQHQNISITSNRNEEPKEPYNGRYIEETLLQERKDEFPSGSIVIGSNKTKHADRYTSKYKDIRKFENHDGQSKSTTLAPSENTSSYKEDYGSKGRNSKKQNRNYATLLPAPEDPLLLWAKFIEALTLAQYSKKGKSFKDPRQGPQVGVNTSDNSTGSIGFKTIFPKHSILRHAERQDINREYHSRLREIEGVEEDTTSTSLRNKSQSILLPFTGASNNSTFLHTTSRPKELVADHVTAKLLISGAETSNASSLSDLQPEQSGQEYQESTPEGSFNPQDEQVVASRRTDSNEYGTPQYLSGDEEEIKLQEEEKSLEEEKDKELQKNVNEWKAALKDAERGIIRTPKVNVKKYPFYKALPSNTLSLYSPLRYAVNPKAVPLKTEGGMEFYESREHIQCPEVTGPQDVVPNRTAPGEWNKKPKARLPRLRGLGDKIDCMRTKYFGSDPLDNPFFKEKTVGLPAHASSDKVESLIDEDALGFYADIMQHIQNIGNINNMPLYSMPKSQRMEFKNTAQQYVKYSSEPETDFNKDSNPYYTPIAGQYILKTATAIPSAGISTGSNDTPGYRPSTENEVTQAPHSNKRPTDIYVSPALHKYRNVDTDTLKYSTDVPTREAEVSGPFSVVALGPYSYPQSESSNYIPGGNTYKPPHQEIILGMVPPPIPTPSYLIMKAVTHTPKVYPTSILSLLNESPVTIRPRRPPVSLYDYRNIQGLIPPSVEFHTKENTNSVYHKENELEAASTLSGDKRGKLTQRPQHGLITGNSYNAEIEPNADVMVAEESSKPESISDVQGHSIHTEKYAGRAIGRHRRERRGATRQDRRNYDDRSNDEHSTTQDDIPRRQHRRLNTKKPTNYAKSKSKGSSVNKQSARGSNSLDKLRRRVDYEDELEYQLDDEDEINNRKGKRLRKENHRRKGSREDDDDSDDTLYTDDAGYDSREAVSHVTSYPDTEVTKEMSKKKPEPKSQDRAPGRDSRRGEPRYYDKEERREEESRILSRDRSDAKRGGGVTRENKHTPMKKGDSLRPARNKTLKAQESKLKNDKNIKLTCKDSDVNGACEDYETDSARISSEEYYDYDNDDHLSQMEDSVLDEGVERPKYSEKISSKGFKNTEDKNKDTDTILEEKSKSNSTNKLKSKYPENVMSADQINRILGGFMSRHNPTYSSKYKADETTIIPDTTNLTTATTSTTSINPITTSNHTDTEEKGSLLESKILTTTSDSKNFQRARVIPIMNAKVIPELVTSTTKSPENNTNRRRSSISRSADKKQSPPKSSKADRGRPSRSKQESRADDKHETPEETKSNKEEKSEYLAIRNVSTSPRDKTNVSRRRNTGSKGNGRKHNSQSELTATTTERASTGRKRIPVRIKGTEREKQATKKDVSSPSNSWRLSRKGRENFVSEATSSSNPSKAENNNNNNNNNNTETLSEDERGNSTTPVPRRLQAIEHRRVTKEEIFTTTYFPEEELAKEMERQSELDAEELEAADESREKVIRDTSDDEDDEEEDVYEPFESYNYESRHVRYPGNRLQHEEYPYTDEDWNSKRGYFIFHEADNPSYNYYQPETKRKENKGAQRYENRHYNHKAGHTENNSKPSEADESQQPDVNSDSDGQSKHDLSTEDPPKVVTKSGIKGFYIQRSLDSTSKLTSPNSKKEDTKEKSSATVLTYVVDQNTGEGSWVPGVGGTTNDERGTVKSERNKEENLEVEKPARVSVRGSSKNRNNWRNKFGKPSNEQKVLWQKEEYQEQNPEGGKVTDNRDVEVEASNRGRKSPDKFKTNRDKSLKKTQSSNQDAGEYMAHVSPDEISGVRNLNPSNIKKSFQNRPRKASGKYRQKNKTESAEQSSHETSDFNKRDDDEKVINSEKSSRGKAAEKKQILPDDDVNDKSSETYKLDRVSKTGKSAHRRNKSRQYKSNLNKFKDTDDNINSSASEIRYYEEALPEATTYSEQENEEYKGETSSEEGNEEDNHDEAIASAFGKILSNIPPKDRGRSEDVEGTDDVQRFVKHPGERYYYYVDEPEDTGGKEGQVDRASKSYRNKQLRRRDETIED